MHSIWLEETKLCFAYDPLSLICSFPATDRLLLQQSELALLVSGDSIQDIIFRCLYHNERIPWEALMAQTAHFKNVPFDPLEQFLNLEEFQMPETTAYEPMAQPNDLVHDYDGPVCLSRLFREEAHVDFRPAVVR